MLPERPLWSGAPYVLRLDACCYDCFPCGSHIAGNGEGGRIFRFSKFRFSRENARLTQKNAEHYFNKNSFATKILHKSDWK